MVPPVSVAAVHDKLICVLEAALAARLVGAVGMVTVKAALLLAIPPTVTTTLPVVAPEGTGTTMVEELQLVGVLAIPLNVTVLAPCDAPKLVPSSVTGVPTGPEGGDTVVMFGVIVKFTPLLTTPPNVTVTLPLVAPNGTGTTILVGLQLVTDGATKPLKLTWPEPKAPKPLPVIVTAAP
jgi:hypothetical protein